MGKLSLISAMGQPFRAEIELVAVKNEEKSMMTAGLAPEQIFREANVNYLPLLSTFHATIEIHSDGRPYLGITSSQPIAEKVLNLLIELNWPSGRVIREYIVVLAPPEGNVLTQANALVETPGAIGVSARERPGFSGAEAATEKLKQTVSGKIEPSPKADSVSSNEKEAGRGILNLPKGMELQNAAREAESDPGVQVNGRNGSPRVGTHAMEGSATDSSDLPAHASQHIAQLEKNIQGFQGLRQLPELKNPILLETRKPADALAWVKVEVPPLASVSLPAAAVAVQSGIDQPEEALPGDEAIDKPVAIAKPVQAALMSVRSSDGERDFPAHTPGRWRSIVDELTSNLEFLGGAIALLVTGIVGVSIARRPKEAEECSGENRSKVTRSPTGREALTAIVPQKADASPVQKTDRTAQTLLYEAPSDTQIEAIPQAFRNTQGVEGKKTAEKSPQFSGLQECSSSRPPIPSVTRARLAGTNPNSVLHSNYVTAVPLPERGIRWREIFSKLDLARAYQEMGDKDAALQVLKEVVRDGDAAQRESARRILANL